MSFHYKNLDAYKESIKFAEKASIWNESWSNRFSITNQLFRASRSIPTHIAIGTLQESMSAAKAKYEIAIGSCLECAACLDIADIYSLISSEIATSHKKSLLAITQMTMGLCRAAENKSVQEDEPTYHTFPKVEKPIFYHENLDLYSVAIEFAQWSYNLFCQKQATEKALFQELDSALTSILLNIAEGNGRFSKKDKNRFLGYARDGAVKAATAIDIALLDSNIPNSEAKHGESLLARITAMVYKLIGTEKFQ